MKIAVPLTKENQIDDHFGHCESYGIYTLSTDKKIENKEVLESEQGCGCKSNIASTLATKGVKVILAGGIGNGAINVLNKSGIEVIRGCSGDAASVVADALGRDVHVRTGGGVQSPPRPENIVHEQRLHFRKAKVTLQERN